MGGEQAEATDWTADISRRQLPLSSVLQVLILPVCPGGGQGEDARGADLLLLTSHSFDFKEELTGRSTEWWLSGILCPVQQKVPEVSYQQFQTLTTSPDSITHIVCLEREGKGQLFLKVAACCPLCFPDSWSWGCILKIIDTSHNFSP